MVSFVPKGVCAKRIDFAIDEDSKVRDVRFEGGCSGNSAGVAKLVEGRDADEIVGLLGGITCGRKDTSCPDQLAQALTEALAAQRQ